MLIDASEVIDGGQLRVRVYQKLLQACCGFFQHIYPFVFCPDATIYSNYLLVSNFNPIFGLKSPRLHAGPAGNTVFISLQLVHLLLKDLVQMWMRIFLSNRGGRYGLQNQFHIAFVMSQYPYLNPCFYLFYKFLKLLLRHLVPSTSSKTYTWLAGHHRNPIGLHMYNSY